MAMQCDHPCDYVVNMEKRISALEGKVDNYAVDLAEMKKDIEYIKEKVSARSRFDGGIIGYIAQGIITILLGYIAVRLGLGS